MCVSASVSLLLVVVLYSLLCTGEPADIDPSKIIIATVVDTSNGRIVADSKTLFRSIRLFGEDLNEATLLACIVTDPNTAFADDNLLEDYYALGVIVDFIRQVNPPFPRTMNKFSAFFKFDATNYDYFLWLDADTVIFSNPLVALPSISLSGVYCVPELYNYMIRYPRLNGSSLFWNPELFPFQLAGDHSIAPHGVCNTGMLLFGKLALRSFLDHLYLPDTVKQLSWYNWDRFLDSLYFVATVNKAGLEVTPVNNSLNYMAFLETDIIHLSLAADPVIAHFIANTSLNCYTVPISVSPTGCTCMYANDDVIPSDSRIVSHVVEQLLPVYPCFVLAGKQAAVSPYFTPPTIDTKIYPSMCDDPVKIRWPTNGIRLFYSLNQISFPVHLSCCPKTEMGLDECSCDKAALRVRLKHSGDVLWQRALSQINSTTSNTISDDGHCFRQEKVIFDAPGETASISVLLEVYVKTDEEFLDETGQVSTAYDRVHTIELLLLSQSFLIGRKRFGVSLMSGGAPLSLPAQAYLADYLNTRRQRDFGVALCCDTSQGVRTVERLISSWGVPVSEGEMFGGAILVIVVKSAPGLRSASESTQLLARNDLVQHFSSICNRTSRLSRGPGLAGCVVTLTSMTSVFSFAKGEEFYRRNFLSFVYVDFFSVADEYMSEIRLWIQAVRYGGLIMGSRYLPDMIRNRDNSNSIALAEAMILTEIATAVETSAYEIDSAVFATYFEYVDISIHNTSAYTSLPGWYILKSE